mgnify:CR=1 FL=1
MKNDQKNPIFQSVPFLCMLEQLLAAELDKSNKWHLNIHIWSWIWIFDSNQLHLIWLLVALAQIKSYCHVMILHHIVALHWLCCFSVAGVCPLSVDDVLTMSSMTPMKSYTIFRSARQAKPPCSFRYNPTLSLLLSFTALGQQRFNCYLLR